MLKPILLDYNILELNVKTLHPVRAKKFSQILHVVRDCIDKGIRPTYRIIHETTKISSRTIAAFWKWMKEQGVGLKDIFMTRVEEVAGTIQDMMVKGVKPKYRELRKKIKCSFSTISKAFKSLKNAFVPSSQNHIESVKLTYNNARKKFHELSQAEKEKYYNQARSETELDDPSVIEKFAISIFARTISAAKINNNTNNNVEKETLNAVTVAQVLAAINGCLKAKGLKLFKGLSRKERRSLSKLLKQGYTIDDIIKVIKFKADEWLNETKMVPSFRPKTLLAPDNFHRYFNQLNLNIKTQSSNFRPLKEGTIVEYNGAKYVVEEDGWIYINQNSIIPPAMAWKLVQAGKMKILRGKDD